MNNLCFGSGAFLMLTEGGLKVWHQGVRVWVGEKVAPGLTALGCNMTTG